MIYWVDQPRTSRHYQQPFEASSGKTLFRVSSLVVYYLGEFLHAECLTYTNYVLTKFELSKPADILKQVTNPVVWKNRYDWDVYSTYLNIGLYKADLT
ncbi:Wzy polymerase domain-containing protein [Vibrio lentus]|nr:Wzy polymerase domain-containing protein [Vibrio lentus]